MPVRLYAMTLNRSENIAPTHGGSIPLQQPWDEADPIRDRS